MASSTNIKVVCRYDLFLATNYPRSGSLVSDVLQIEIGFDRQMLSS